MAYEVIVVGALASIGPTLMGYAAYRQAAGANKAVNHQGPETPSILQLVRDTHAMAQGTNDEVQALSQQVVEIRGDMADLTELRRQQEEAHRQMQQQLEQHLAYHQDQTERHPPW